MGGAFANHRSLGCWLAALASGAFLYGADLDEPALRADELVYDAAAEAVRHGDPPGSVRGWYYPDSLAHAAAALPEPRWLPLRTLDLTGAIVTAAVAAESMGMPLVAILVMLSPPVVSGIGAGNVSGLLTGLCAAAARWPRGAVGLLPVGALIKPYTLGSALAAGPVLGGLTTLVAALAWRDATGSRALFNLDSDPNSSLVRALHQLGLAVPWEVPSGAALLGALWFGKRNPARAAALGWLALPIAWDHTALLGLLAAALAWPNVWGPREKLALVWCATVFCRAHYFAIPDGPDWASGLLGLMPATAALTVAILARPVR